MLDRVLSSSFLLQVTSSSKMEAFAAKSLLINLATEHDLIIHTLTTDRSSDMKALLKYVD